MSNCWMQESRRRQKKGENAEGHMDSDVCPGDMVKSRITVIFGWSAACSYKNVYETDHNRSAAVCRPVSFLHGHQQDKGGN